MKSLITICSFLLFTIAATAQPGKFGKVSKSDINQTIDTESELFAIFDYGKLDIKDNFNYHLTRHQRVKVNSNEENHTVFEFSFNSEQLNQELIDFEILEFELENGRKVRKNDFDESKLSKTESVSGWVNYKLSSKDLEPGKVLDITYTIRYDGASQLPRWYFEHTYPVIWSELEAVLPNILRFDIKNRFRKDLAVNERNSTSTVIKYSEKNKIKSNVLASDKEMKLTTASEVFRLVMKDTEGVDEVPLMSSVNNFRSYVQFQLENIEITRSSTTEIDAEFGVLENRNVVFEEVINTWDEVYSFLMENEYFGEQLASEGWSKQVARNESGNSNTGIERVQKLFDYLSTYEVSEKDGYYIHKPLSDVYKDKSGSSSEINMLMVKLLREIGIPADPVLISTRSNGAVSRDLVNISQFNRTLTYAEFSGKQIIFDASNGSESLFMKPELLNGSGFKLSSYEWDWINLSNQQITKTAVEIDQTIDSEGIITGVLSLNAEGFDALTIEKALKENRDDVISNLINTQTDIELSSVQVNSSLFTEPSLVIRAEFKQSDNSENSKVTISPGGFELFDIPELSDKEDRNISFQFPHTFLRNMEITVKYPENMAIEGFPENKSVFIPGTSINYTNRFSNFANEFKVTRNFVIASNSAPKNTADQLALILSNAKNDTGQFTFQFLNQ